MTELCFFTHKEMGPEWWRDLFQLYGQGGPRTLASLPSSFPYTATVHTTSCKALFAHGSLSSFGFYFVFCFVGVLYGWFCFCFCFWWLERGAGWGGVSFFFQHLSWRVSSLGTRTQVCRAPKPWAHSLRCTKSSSEAYAAFYICSPAMISASSASDKHQLGRCLTTLLLCINLTLNNGQNLRLKAKWPCLFPSSRFFQKERNKTSSFIILRHFFTFQHFWNQGET